MRNYGKPVTDDIVREFLPLDLALYSMWMPGDMLTATIQSTRLNPICTYDETIELDDVATACVAYLLRVGAPVFRDVKMHDAYLQALENQLRRGLAPAAARDAARRASGVQPVAGDSRGVGPEPHMAHRQHPCGFLR